MPRRISRTIAFVGVVAALAAVVAYAASGGDSRFTSPRFVGGPLRTALIDPGTSDVALADVRRTGATFIRANLSWYGTAPNPRPQGFDATNPNSPGYNWSAFDAKLRQYRMHGLEVVAAVNDAPPWARLGSNANSPPDPDSPPDPGAFGQFMGAAAKRYPSIRYWQIWVEPNLTPFFTAQFRNGQPYAPIVYRAMVNDAYRAIHAVRPNDVVIAGDTAPFRDVTPSLARQLPKKFWASGYPDWGPLAFMRVLFCLGADLHPTCHQQVHFDAWATHPYTSGGPYHHAVLPNDVSLGDLPKMRATLAAAMRARNLVAPHGLALFVTEFSWDSNPPDPRAVPMKVLPHWVSEALYVMWRNGISLVTWLQLQDQPLTTSYYQSGLWYAAPSLATARPKAAVLEAFRFPVVALRRGGGIYVWGRTPTSASGTVVVQHSSPSGWQTVGTAGANRNGIFQRVFRTGASGLVRARFRSEVSTPYSIAEPPDHFYNPFGEPKLLEPHGRR